MFVVNIVNRYDYYAQSMKDIYKIIMKMNILLDIFGFF